jgi:uncharacterized cupin superfamily protein
VGQSGACNDRRVTLAHWDDVPANRVPMPNVGGAWQLLGQAAGAVTMGVNRVRLDPGEVATPAHVHGADEEIFHVLSGSGLSWQDGTTYEVRAGDTLVHRVRREAHTLRAGDDGLEFLVFGGRTAIGGAYLPKAGLYWLYPSWTEAGGGEHPFAREQHLEWPEPQAERPETIVHLHDVEGDYGGISKALGREAGARRSGLNRVALPPNEEGAPPHCHSADEELFVVLEGEGELELWSRPDPANQLQTEPAERHPLRAGHVISRPAATRVPHSLRSGPAGMTYLAYGTKEPNDLCWYPRSNKVFLRGLGVIARLELLEYGDGEPG